MNFKTHEMSSQLNYQFTISLSLFQCCAVIIFLKNRYNRQVIKIPDPKHSSIHRKTINYQLLKEKMHFEYNKNFREKKVESFKSKFYKETIVSHKNFKKKQSKHENASWIQVKNKKKKERQIINEKLIIPIQKSKQKSGQENRCFIRFTMIRDNFWLQERSIWGSVVLQNGQYQLQVLALQFNYLMLMKASEGVVKVEPDDNFLKWSNLNVGPFKIQHGSAEKKMVFVPTQGSWTNFQNAKYAAYILANKNKMENRPQSKLWQLYKEMSLFITSRNFRQCKTHHQRLTQISVTFSGIINYLRNTIEDFNSLLTIQMQCYKNFQTKKSDKKIPAENPQVENVPQQVISPTDKKQTDGPTADSYVPEPMKGFPPILNQNVLGSTFPIYMPPYQPSKSTAEEWLECHNLFLQWTKKLQQLNSMSSYY